MSNVSIWSRGARRCVCAEAGQPRAARRFSAKHRAARDIAVLDRARVTVPDFMVPAASVIARIFPSLTPNQAGSRSRPKKKEKTRDFARRLWASTRICIKSAAQNFHP